eukprot:CAMPEP_0181180774 /NCGR_PEP_ID=MMETSP1096-20121128/6978_1 /TAXON_ID=156174 ORGANISM="Chrysochromulina ericina, Strain CCMP281" /NCGR_SAMPLE_ID=MMETSP1096 /ASSEMBLY_ACC=CAM_ASM_000453 /LENGTH=169 /DNA_ID=CAMNT_0023269223 /DNA_START=77 /DNA_END=588 /DNA_ORIENTATION=+
MIGMTESLLYARKAGLDTEGVIAAMGPAQRGLINNLGLRQSRGDFAPGFMIEHMAKDLGIALAEANRMQLELPGLELAERLYAGLMLQGHGKDGTQALVLALDDMLHQDGGDHCFSPLSHVHRVMMDTLRLLVRTRAAERMLHESTPLAHHVVSSNTRYVGLTWESRES